MLDIMATKVAKDFITTKEDQMNTITIKNDVRAFLKGFSGGREFNDDDLVFGSGLINSLFAMQLVMYLEKAYSIKVVNQDLDLKNFETLNAIAAFVDKKLSA